MTAWNDADPLGPNGLPHTFGDYTRIPIANLLHGSATSYRTADTRESAKHRAVVWLPSTPGPWPTLVLFHGFGIGVRAHTDGTVTDRRYYALDLQLPHLVVPHAVVLPQGGLHSEFDSAASDPLEYLGELEVRLGVTFGGLVLGAHSGGGPAILKALETAKSRVTKVAWFEALNGPHEAERVRAWAKTATIPMHFVSGTSGYYVNYYRPLAKALAGQPLAHFTELHADHRHMVGAENVLATVLNATS